MRICKSTALLLCVISFPLTSCERKHEVKVSISALSARASSCAKEACSNIIFDLKIQNDMEIPACISVRYVTSSISRSVVVARDKAGDSVEEFRTVFDPSDMAPDVPNGEMAHVAMLRSEPNVYIAPKSTLTYTAETGDKYKLPKARLNASLSIYAYPCANTEYSQLGYIRLMASTPLVILGG